MTTSQHGTVDLTAAPFGLDRAGTDWVETTLAGLTTEQKVGQLLCLYLRGTDMPTWTAWLDRHRIRPGGVLLVARPLSAARADLAHLQVWSEVPLLTAANLESGTVNFLHDTEAFANPMQIAATRDAKHAERLAIHCARIAHDIGVNWAFAPVVDVTINPHNPITNTRAFGRDPELVATMAETYIRALEERGIATSPKHFPGDGVDDRDQHLVTSNNDLDVDTWEHTYAPVYRRAVAAGARTIMVGHIRQPALTRDLVPGVAPADILPASLAPELVTGVLRERLGFHGMIVTDNSAMAGMTAVMPRRDALPRAILAGCDMILGNVDVAEDFRILLDAVETHTIPPARLDDAVRRVLAVKASIGLHQGPLRPGRERPDSRQEGRWRTELAEDSVTLVKDTQSLLPLDPRRHRRALVYVLGDQPTFYDPSGPFADHFAAGLRKRGLEVELRHVPGEGRSIEQAARLHRDFDVCIYFANVRFLGNGNFLRLSWTPWQGPDAPRHVTTLPTVLVSIADPYLLQDMPMVKTAINGYTPTSATVDACLAGLFGEIEFRGTSPVDPFAGHWDAAL